MGYAIPWENSGQLFCSEVMYDRVGSTGHCHPLWRVGTNPPTSSSRSQNSRECLVHVSLSRSTIATPPLQRHSSREPLALNLA